MNDKLSNDKINKFPTWMEFLPSLIWLFFMVVPFLIQRPSLSILGTFDQIIATCSVLIVFLISDFIAFRWKKPFNNLFDGAFNSIKFNSNYITIIIILMFFVLSVLNIWLMPDIPVLKLISGENFSNIELSQLRHMATKKINAPKIILYSFNWIILIFVPISIAMLLRNSRYYLAIGIFVWALIYSTVTMAKLPAVAMIFILALSLSSIYFRIAFYTKWIIIIVITIIGFLAIFYVSPFKIKSTSDITFSTQVEKFEITDPRSYNTIADDFRSLGHVSAKNLSEYSSYLDGYTRYLFNRVWLTPSDVSVRWYEYFNYVSSPIGWASVFELSGTDFAPSRKVGIWAYVDKFPEYYISSINAYASFDADAYARGGIMGVFWATLILASFRLLLFLIRGSNINAFPAYSVGLGLLTLLPIQASVQAIFVSNGLLLVLILICIFSLCNKKDEGY